MCLLAVKDNEFAIEYIPKEFATYELWLSELRKNLKLLLILPEYIDTDKLFNDLSDIHNPDKLKKWYENYNTIRGEKSLSKIMNFNRNL